MKGKFKILATAAGVVTALTAVPLAVTGKVYEKHLDKRVHTPEYRRFEMDEFPGLKRQAHPFRSQQNCQLSGYLYYRENQPCRGLIVMAHGIGAGHIAYLDIINFFAKEGFSVFAYDTSGFDDSEGSIRGLQQTVDDLDRAISLAEHFDRVKDCPVLLFGHSWGAYSVSHVLPFHPEVTAIITLAGFDRNRDLISYYGREIAGSFTKAVLPYACVYDRMKFGKYHDSSAADIFRHHDIWVMAVTGDRDQVVPPRFGYDIWKNEFSGEKSFRFVKRNNRGHGTLYYSDRATEYLLGMFKQMSNEMPFEVVAGRMETHINQISDYYVENVDREFYRDMIDYDFAKEMVDFYIEAIEYREKRGDIYRCSAERRE